MRGDKRFNYILLEGQGGEGGNVPGDRCANPSYFCSPRNGHPDHPGYKDFLE